MYILHNEKENRILLNSDFKNCFTFSLSGRLDRIGTIEHPLLLIKKPSKLTMFF